MNAAFLAGLGAVALPILIHLVHRRHAREVPFSSLRYLLHIDERVARRHRLQELAILAMRCGALAFVAMALARPLFRPEGTPVGGRGATTAVFVVDDSYSMGLSEGGVTLFEQARSSAMAIAKALRPGDSALLLAPHRMPPADEIRPSNDLGAVAKQIASMRLSHEPTLLASALAAAFDVLAKAETPNRELYVLSDLQANGWDPILDKGFGERTRDIDVYLVPVGGAEVHNLAVTEVEAVAAGGLREAPVWVTALVSNEGRRDEQARLQVIVDGRAVAEQAISAGRGETVPVAITLPAQSAGIHRGTVRLTGDALAEDDERHFVVDVRDAISVLLVNGRPARSSYENATYYLERALRPDWQGQLAGVQADESRSAIVPEVCKPEELAGRPLATHAAVMLSDVPALSPDAAKALSDWVRGGGAAVVFLGPDVKTAEWNDTLAKTGLAPIRLGPVVGAESQEDVYFTLRDLAPRHPLLAALSRSRPPVDLTTPRFFRYVKISLVGDALVLARFPGGDPALLEARVGAGRVFVCASGCTTEWTNFPLRVSFLPFVHNLVYWLSEGGRGATSMAVGAPLRFPYAAASGARGVQVTLPDGKEVLRSRGEAAGAWEALFDPIREPGFVAWKEDGGDGRGGVLAVNVDADESDLVRVSKQEVEGCFPAGALRVLAPGAEIVSERERSRNGIPLGDVFLILALAMLLGELYLSNRIAFGARPRSAATPEAAQLSRLPGGS